MRRKIYDILLNWKRTSAGKSAIMIDGARRVGKSYIAEKFAKAEYAAYLIIDFAAASRKVKGYFEDYLDDLDTLFTLREAVAKSMMRYAAYSALANFSAI